jgi:outer membrane protein OmpA-like peptidoglycan-associated protein
MSERVKTTSKTPESKTENSASQTKKVNFSHSINSPIDQILFLQRTVGNQAVERLLKSGVIQAKLTIGQADDIYEQEADTIADQVMRMPDLSKAQRREVSKDNKFPSIQRMCTECEEELNGQTKGIQIQRMCSDCEEELHRLPKEIGSETPGISQDVESKINGIRGGGRPLSESVRAFFEPRFGLDFSDVRVHTDSQASESAHAVNALAYTVGRDVVFSGGQYSPGTESGKKLIAHELTHVVQQVGAGRTLQRTSYISAEGADAQTEEASTSVMAVQGTEGLPHSMPVVQRQPAPPLTRAEEVRLSFTTPGEISGTLNPPMISLFNFAIDQPTLKKEHLAALQAIAFLIKLFPSAKVRVEAKGHADSTGDEINQPLSKNRALSVQNILQSAPGVTVVTSHCGELCPVATNDTVEGRSRNRRVDINVFSGKKPDDIDWPSLCALVPALCHCLKNPTLCRKGDGDGDGNGDGDGDGIDWPCTGLGALICGIIVCIAASAILRNPTLCLPGLPSLPGLLCLLFPSLCRHKPKKPDEPKIRVACPVTVELPKGRYVPSTDFITVAQNFQMKLVFKQEPPTKSPYCDCNCGEYRQNVSGFFERNYGQGPLRRITHRVAYGLEMLPNVMREDGDPEPYGHRYEDIWLRSLAPNRDKATDPKGIHDKFIPDREKGCTYEGADEPGMRGVTQDESFHFHLKFEGGPVDSCNGDKRLPGWHQWEVEAERIIRTA